MMRFSISVLVAALVASPPGARAQAQGQSLAIAVRGVSDSVVELTDGSAWRPGFYKISYLGTLRAQAAQPYFLLIAYPCGGACINGPFLYVLHAHDPMSAAAYVGQPPGVQYIVGRRGSWGHTRVYLGRCLTAADTEVVSVWHRDTVPALQDSMTTITTQGAGAQIDVGPVTPQAAESIKRAVAAKKCRPLTL